MIKQLLCRIFYHDIKPSEALLAILKTSPQIVYVRTTCKRCGEYLPAVPIKRYRKYL